MNKKNLLIALGITLIYAIFTFIGVLHHETWADEAQVWQLCKYLTIPELINHLHNEGHPPLFYLIVMPFAKIFPTLLPMQLICWGFMCLASFILLYFSPFKLITKLAILLSAGFLYFFPIIARSYSILPFFVFVAAMLYSKQKEHPILYALTLVAIANTHVIMFGFSSLLFLFFAYDNIYLNLKNKSNCRTYIASGLILFVGLTLVVLQLHDTTSVSNSIYFSINSLLQKTLKVLSHFFINAYNSQITKFLVFRIIDKPFILLLIISFIAMFINIFLKNKRMFFVAFLSISFQFFIYIFAYSAHIHETRVFSAFIILIFCYWVIITSQTDNKTHNNKFINIILVIIFGLTAYNGISYYIKDLNYDYSPANKTAEYIKNNIKKDAIIFVDNEPSSIALIYYLDKDNNADNIFSILKYKNIKYVVWTKNSFYNYGATEWKENIKYVKNQGVKNNIYVLIPYDRYERPLLDVSYPNEFELIYKSPNSILDLNENHKIYKYIGN